MRYWKKESGGSGGITPEMFRCTKMVIDEFTPSSDLMAYETQLNHSMGEVPKVAFVMAKEDFKVTSDTKSYVVQAYFNYAIDIYAKTDFAYICIKRSRIGIGANGSTDSLNNSYKPTSTTIIVGDTDYFKSGVTYQIITMA